jgi:hypothetical protein
MTGFKALPTFVKWILGIVAAFFAIGILGAIFDSGDSQQDDDAPAGAKVGTWDGECEAGFLNKCENEGARDKLDPVSVYCTWNQSDVVVHVELRSHYNARLKVSVIPRYLIEDGGQHGTAFGSEVAQVVEAQGTAMFDINAGHPKGVPVGTAISECKPKLYDVALSDAEEPAAADPPPAPPPPPPPPARDLVPACAKKATDDCIPHVGFGGSVRVDALIWKVTSVRVADALGDQEYGLGAKANGRFVVVTLRVHSEKNESATLTSDVAKLEVGGNTYSTDSDGTIAAMGSGEEPFFLEDIGPDSDVTGKVVFDVPAKVLSRKVEIRFNELGFGSTHGYIRLPAASLR